jgi:hypothetical protein
LYEAIETAEEGVDESNLNPANNGYVVPVAGSASAPSSSVNNTTDVKDGEAFFDAGKN